ncbi:4'-phosphopantetheinyl transferase superfamily protein [Actinomadura sp. DC4]|uniref:4'-phosphopantetheinyl transferase family protein n=1 Tax=Actinomadura sp. DC4 TaxID=3055069 RepID=UPI0025B00719|nr:4'-phosphopantetheinyl transferase superfamily protein [Actinomadura sp. DC4]MDN3355723.1 4'-phosphopantetheinyl transferase superfamily protein [Actinomadura sp. DC4]
MIEKILPPEVASEEAFDDLTEVTLFPEEETVIARSVDKRRREFATARGCARRAMATLDLPPVPILPGERGAPAWPPGVVGSMTHCDGYRAAAVALQDRVRTVGVDAEPNGPLPEGVLEAIATPPELEWMKNIAGDASGVCWDRLLFSAKETIYKAWFPLTRLWLNFEEAVVTPDPDAGTFTARLLVPGPVVDGRTLSGFAGRWMADRGLVATSITVLAEV